MTIRLAEWLDDQPAALGDVISALALACQEISTAISLGPLAGLHGKGEGHNTHGEAQHKLDVFADRCIAGTLAVSHHVAGWASEEQELPTLSPSHGEQGEYLVVFDPLDGSSNIDANISVGTIFSVLKHPFRGTPPGEAGFLQPGRRQVAAGYAVYGPATLLVLSCGDGVAAFTLDRRERVWQLTSPELRISEQTREFAINASNQRFWEKPVQRYVAECLAGTEGPRAADFNMRWVASLVAEVHRIFSRGGVFMYPRDNKEPRKAGRLRLMYEAAPMAFLVEQAGGAAVTGTQALLDIVPDTLHQKVPVILGSKGEVERIVRYHADPHENTHWPLFKERSLFVPPAG
ncbi:MAG: class 1 fructose-bisphosphatase [Burkholderiales bacterium]|nr:class 1 fructose-bisphosphatase [Burkholderiales bacterium]